MEKHVFLLSILLSIHFDLVSRVLLGALLDTHISLDKKYHISD